MQLLNLISGGRLLLLFLLLAVAGALRTDERFLLGGEETIYDGSTSLIFHKIDDVPVEVQLVTLCTVPEEQANASGDFVSLEDVEQNKRYIDTEIYRCSVGGGHVLGGNGYKRQYVDPSAYINWEVNCIPSFYPDVEVTTTETIEETESDDEKVDETIAESIPVIEKVIQPPPELKEVIHSTLNSATVDISSVVASLRKESYSMSESVQEKINKLHELVVLGQSNGKKKTKALNNLISELSVEVEKNSRYENQGRDISQLLSLWEFFKGLYAADDYISYDGFNQEKYTYVTEGLLGRYNGAERYWPVPNPNEPTPTSKEASVGTGYYYECWSEDHIDTTISDPSNEKDIYIQNIGVETISDIYQVLRRYDSNGDPDRSSSDYISKSILHAIEITNVYFSSYYDTNKIIRRIQDLSFPNWYILSEKSGCDEIENTCSTDDYSDSFPFNVLFDPEYIRPTTLPTVNVYYGNSYIIKSFASLSGIRQGDYKFERIDENINIVLDRILNAAGVSVNYTHIYDDYLSYKTNDVGAFNIDHPVDGLKRIVKCERIDDVNSILLDGEMVFKVNDDNDNLLEARQGVEGKRYADIDFRTINAFGLYNENQVSLLTSHEHPNNYQHSYVYPDEFVWSQERWKCNYLGNPTITSSPTMSNCPSTVIDGETYYKSPKTYYCDQNGVKYSDLGGFTPVKCDTKQANLPGAGVRMESEVISPRGFYPSTCLYWNNYKSTVGLYEIEVVREEGVGPTVLNELDGKRIVYGSLDDYIVDEMDNLYGAGNAGYDCIHLGQNKSLHDPRQCRTLSVPTYPNDAYYSGRVASSGISRFNEYFDIVPELTDGDDLTFTLTPKDHIDYDVAYFKDLTNCPKIKVTYLDDSNCRFEGWERPLTNEHYYEFHYYFEGREGEPGTDNTLVYSVNDGSSGTVDIGTGKLLDVTLVEVDGNGEESRYICNRLKCIAERQTFIGYRHTSEDHIIEEIVEQVDLNGYVKADYVLSQDSIVETTTKQFTTNSLDVLEGTLTNEDSRLQGEIDDLKARMEELLSQLNDGGEVITVTGPKGDVGPKGIDGTSCTVQRYPGERMSIISCTDGTYANILDGEQGEKGDIGNTNTTSGNVNSLNTDGEADGISMMGLVTLLIALLALIGVFGILIAGYVSFRYLKLRSSQGVEIYPIGK